MHIVSGLTLVSRVGGLARDVVTARVFGDTAIGSAFAAAFAIPNLFRRLFGEGALSAAFIPEYTEAIREDPALADRFASLTVAILLVLVGTITLLLEGALALTLAIAPFDPDRSLTLKLVMVMLPFMPLVCVSAVLGGMLQVHHRFGPPAAAPVVLNVLMVGVGLWHFASGAEPTHTAYLLGIAAIVAGLIQVSWSMLALRRHVAWTRVFYGAAQRTRRMARRFVPVVIGLGTIQVNAFLDAFICLWPVLVGPTIFGITYPLEDGSYVLITHATRLYQFPLGVFGIAIATAIFPLLARNAGDERKTLETLRQGIRLAWFIALPASIGLLLVRQDLVEVMYAAPEVFDRSGQIAAPIEGEARNGFSREGIIASANILLAYAVAVWAYSLNHVLTRAFYARGDTTTPMRIALVMVALNLTLNLILIWPLQEAGLAASTALCAMLQCGILFTLLQRRLSAPIIDADTRGGLTRAVIASAIMGGGVALLEALLPMSHAWSQGAFRLAALTFAGTAIYAVAAALIAAPELRWLIRR